MRISSTLALMVIVGGSVACRPDIGTPVYQNGDDFNQIDAPPPEPKLGEDPYQEGEERLSLGAFYEGGFSQEIAIDDLTTHFYIYGLESDGTPTFRQREETTIVEEGIVSDLILHGGTPWWGGGIQWDTGRDLSKWTTMWLSLRSSDPAYETVQIHLLTEGGEGILETADYGYANDGEWHHIALPLEDFAGADLTQVTGPFILIGGGGAEDEELYVDNVYYSQD